MARHGKRLFLRAGGLLAAAALLLALAGLYWRVRNLGAEVERLRARVEASERGSKASAAGDAAPGPARDYNVSERVSHNGHSYDTYTVDVGRAAVGLFYRGGEGERLASLGKLKEYVESGSGELLFATNAGMYTVEGAPLGLFVEGGREVVPLNLSDGRDNFYMKPNGVFALAGGRAYVVESSQFREVAAASRVELATQSGPLLVSGGALHAGFKERSENVNIRSGVGLIGPTKVVFAISNEPVNFYDFATLFRDRFGCRDALYLDGAVSRMYLPALKRYELDGDFAGIIAVTRGAGRPE